MEDFKIIREFILQLMREAGLHEENTLRELMDRISLDDWSSIEEYMNAGQFKEETTILELLAAIQNADVAPEID